MPIPNPIYNPQKIKVLGDNLSILLFGSTGAGKTPMIGELAEEYFKLYKRKTRLAAADKGGWDSIRPYIELGIIELEPMFGNPWLWWNHMAAGEIYRNGAWINGANPEIALYAYEGMTTLADDVMSWMAEASGRGVNIGGGGAMNFAVQEGADKLKIGTNNMGHYKVAQGFVYDVVVKSQYLPATVLWTAGDSRTDDDAVGGVVGPQTAGKAQSAEVARWFNRTFHITAEVSPGSVTTHTLHLDQHTDLNSKGMAKAFTNARVPLAGSEGTAIPSSIQPASIVKALELLTERQVSATDEIRKRLGL